LLRAFSATLKKDTRRTQLLCARLDNASEQSVLHLGTLLWVVMTRKEMAL
jgi:hypothetical protein